MGDRGVAVQQEIRIAAGGAELPALLEVPRGAAGVVVYLPGCRSELTSEHGKYLSERIVEAGYGVLRVDLLTAAEDRGFAARSDTERLAARLLAVMRWVAEHEPTHGLPLGLYAAHTGADAALRALAELAAEGGEYLVRCLVCRSGRPDPTREDLEHVNVPTLLLVAARDAHGLRLNRGALTHLDGESALEVVGETSADFDGDHAIERLAALSLAWYERYL